MLANIKIGKRLAIGFGLILLFLVAVGICGIWGVKATNTEADQCIKVEAKIVELAERIRANTLILRRYEKDVFLNIASPEKVSEYVKKWQEAEERIGKRLDELDKLVTDPKDKEAVKGVRTNLQTYAAGFKTVMSAISNGQVKTPEDGNKAIGAYKEATHAMEKVAWDFAAVGVTRLEAAEKALDELQDHVTTTMYLLIAIAVFATFVVTWTITRSITRPMSGIESMLTDIAEGEGDLTKRLEYVSNDELGIISAKFNIFMEKLRTIISQVAQNSAQVASAANQLQATSVQTANGADEVAAQAGIVATAAEEMAATSGDIAQNCHLAADGSRHANDTASAGAAVVEKTVAVMNEIAFKVQESAQTVGNLGTRSDQIGAIIGTIEDIADQTNLLALNAAIEAARAGEQGRGFAVVADEVRALAERTTKATREIGEMIKAIQAETRGAVAVMEEGVHQVDSGTSEAAKSGAALQEILDQVNAVSMQVNQIATAAEQQTATSSEISGNIQQITEVIQQTARGAEESASAARQLAVTAEELQRLVGQFKL